MELTAQQEADVQKIMGEMDCPRGFRCYESGFEDLSPVKVISSNAIECFKAKKSFCRMSVNLGLSTMICTCPLRKYVALELGR
ncbi:MAG: hypothetical protein ACYSWQ_01330 [Planctomycetota bacterium]|jgi:hypothetical protein